MWGCGLPCRGSGLPCAAAVPPPAAAAPMPVDHELAVAHSCRDQVNQHDAHTSSPPGGPSSGRASLPRSPLRPGPPRPTPATACIYTKSPRCQQRQCAGCPAHHQPAPPACGAAARLRLRLLCRRSGIGQPAAQRLPRCHICRGDGLWHGRWGSRMAVVGAGCVGGRCLHAKRRSPQHYLPQLFCQPFGQLHAPTIRRL